MKSTGRHGNPRRVSVKSLSPRPGRRDPPLATPPIRHRSRLPFTRCFLAKWNSLVDRVNPSIFTALFYPTTEPRWNLLRNPANENESFFFHSGGPTSPFLPNERTATLGWSHRGSFGPQVDRHRYAHTHTHTHTHTYTYIHREGSLCFRFPRVYIRRRASETIRGSRARTTLSLRRGVRCVERGVVVIFLLLRWTYLTTRKIYIQRVAAKYHSRAVVKFQRSVISFRDG